MKRIKVPRDCFVAIADVSGEYEGNPAAFDAAQVYGPFTAEEALRLSQVDEEAGGFPHATWTVTIFQAKRKTEKQLTKIIRETVAIAIQEKQSE